MFSDVSPQVLLPDAPIQPECRIEFVVYPLLYLTANIVAFPEKVYPYPEGLYDIPVPETKVTAPAVPQLLTFPVIVAVVLPTPL